MMVKKKQLLQDIELEAKEEEELKDPKYIILETYANILLNQDKALIANHISKNCIIVPSTSLSNIIKAIVKAESVEISLDEDIKCCSSKVNPIRKIEAIKIVNDNGEVCTDFKQVYNREYNELVNKYHLCLKYGINM